MPFEDAPVPARHVLTVYDAQAFRCVAGVNHGEALAVAETLCLGDSYRLDPKADPIRLELEPGTETDSYRVVAPPGMEPGRTVTPGPTLTVMTGTGATARVRSLLIEGETYVLPLGEVDLFAAQTLIALDTTPAPLPLADPTCLAFARGTRLTTAEGHLVPIEDLSPGTRLLTRDGRAAPVLALLGDSVPAIGRATRVVIRAEAFNNETELVVTADHRLFVPGRRSEIDPHAPDRMEPARKLVNGLTITADPGGRIEVFHVLLDRHDVIYAEGIPCESFLLTGASRAGLAPHLRALVEAAAPDLVHTPHPASVPPDLRPARPGPARPASGTAQAV